MGMWYDIPVNTPHGAPKMQPWAQQISDTLRRTNNSADGGPGIARSTWMAARIRT
jgi:predicted ribonuclease YlaK